MASESFENWASDMIKYLAEDIRETKKLVKQTKRQADASEKKADAAMKTAEAAMSEAKAAWELVVITRNEIKRVWWKKLFDIR